MDRVLILDRPFNRTRVLGAGHPHTLSSSMAWAEWQAERLDKNH
jgi:hypothetical protein